ncbi:MAG: lipoyl synthase [Bacteroidetes bacterium]|nr:MAG: lipoyl synthase [Bacteroidota bacterium]
MQSQNKQTSRRKPDWLKIKLPQSTKYANVQNVIKNYGLHTICTSGKCPNLGECWDNGTATLMILGDICTRACKFCAVKTGKPLNVDKNEPIKVARSVKILNLKHCVLTSVDRDDLPDKGAGIWAETVREIKKINPNTTIETLIPDFDGDKTLIQKVIDAGPEVISHNLETVKRLTPQIRSRAKYKTSLKVIKYLSNAGVISKSGIMVGLGETFDEVVELMDDLRAVGCKVLTIGQYLQPTPQHAEVIEYVHPDVFKKWAEIALAKGFTHVESSPLVRSSYHAEKHVN